MCDMFIGSRMHSCIAAVSQCIRAVSMAYSKKFIGVMKTLGMSDLVADLRVLTKDQILEIIANTYTNREIIKKKLDQTMPKVKSYIHNEFNAILNV